MELKKEFVLIIFLINLVGRINATNNIQARIILDKTAACIGSKGGTSANFQILGGKIKTTSGSIAIKGNKFHARTPQAIIWYDGKTQWTYMKKANEVNISSPTVAQQVSINPYTFINIYRSGYNITMKVIDKNYQIHLISTDNRKSIKEMYLLINKVSYHPIQIKMRPKDEWITVNITNFNKKNLPNSTFIFKAKDCPSAEIIDLR